MHVPLLPLLLLCMQVWPGKTVYPDYLGNANTSRWLVENLQHMYDKVPYDGLWLDMNEVRCMNTLVEN
jgi:alpha-glucosidase (family GH31 glycosyl hydrolase)